MSGQFTLADAQNLINDLEKGERLHRLYKEAGLVAAKVANLLQAEKDAADRARKAQDDELAILANIEKKLISADAEVEAKLKDVQSAVNEAASIRAQAVEDAKRVKDAAQKSVQDYKDACKADLDLLADNIAAKNGELVEISASIGKASAELNKINEALANARNQLKGLLG